MRGEAQFFMCHRGCTYDCRAEFKTILRRLLIDGGFPKNDGNQGNDFARIHSVLKNKSISLW